MSLVIDEFLFAFEPRLVFNSTGSRQSSDLVALWADVAVGRDAFRDAAFPDRRRRQQSDIWHKAFLIADALRRHPLKHLVNPHGQKVCVRRNPPGKHR